MAKAVSNIRARREARPRLRAVEITPSVNDYAEGSALIRMGNTRVLCTASVEERTPEWMRGKGTGWVTAEYGMLPRATSTRNRRERDKVAPRSLEISRLIGRALRAAVDLRKLGERLITVDCDVIQADGGTRTAAITGGMVALALAGRWLAARKLLSATPVTGLVAAVSVGIVEGGYCLDLDYDHDHRAEVDMNVAMNDKGEFVEIQGSAEGNPFSPTQLRRLEELAAEGIRKLIAIQRRALKT